MCIIRFQSSSLNNKDNKFLALKKKKIWIDTWLNFFFPYNIWNNCSFRKITSHIQNYLEKTQTKIKVCQKKLYLIIHPLFLYAFKPDVPFRFERFTDSDDYFLVNSRQWAQQNPKLYFNTIWRYLFSPFAIFLYKQSFNLFCHIHRYRLVTKIRPTYQQMETVWMTVKVIANHANIQESMSYNLIHMIQSSTYCACIYWQKN